MAVIRVGGHLGAGKSTLSKRLAKHYDYAYFYAGGIFREMAQGSGLTIEEFYEQLSANPELEKSIDARQEQLMVDRDNLIVEGRIAAFLRCSFAKVNIFIKASEDESIRRLMKRPETQGRSFREVEKLLRKRVQLERERYLALYGITDHLDERKYDIVIDATQLNPDELFREAIRQIDGYLKKPE